MLRRAAVATFVFAIVLVAACGRQITPEPSSSNSNLAGHMVVRFRVNGTLAFSTYNYQIVIDTCGEGVPYPNPATNTVKSYSYSFNVGTSPYGVLQVYPTLLQYKLTTGTNGLSPLLVQPNPSLESFTPNSDGTGAEFELIFDRELLDNPLNLAQPCPSFTQPPAAATTALAPSAAAGESPLAQRPIAAVADAATLAPVATATLAPLAAATVAPGPKPTVPVQSTWIINFIVLTAQGVPLDSLGAGGPSDVQFGGIVVDTQTQQQLQVLKTPDSNGGPTDPNAAIASGGEVDNYP